MGQGGRESGKRIRMPISALGDLKLGERLKP